MLKNGDLVQFGTDTQVTVEVCLGLLGTFLLCHLYWDLHMIHVLHSFEQEAEG